MAKKKTDQAGQEDQAELEFTPARLGDTVLLKLASHAGQGGRINGQEYHPAIVTQVRDGGAGTTINCRLLVDAIPGSYDVSEWQGGVLHASLADEPVEDPDTGAPVPYRGPTWIHLDEDMV